MKLGLFTDLWKWSKGQDENFMTDSLRVVLSAILHESPETLSAILSKALGDLSPSLAELSDASVVTQTRRVLGITDLELFSPDYHLILEAKVDAAVDAEQLARYRRELNLESPAKRKVLVLLTAEPAGKAVPEGVDAWINWRSIGAALESMLSGEQGSVASDMLVREFLDLLRTRGMTMNKVTVPMGAALASMFAFMDLIREGLNANDIPNFGVWSFSERQQYVGYSVSQSDKHFWVGSSQMFPDELRFETDQLKLPSGLVIDHSGAEDQFSANKWRRSMRIDENFTVLELPEQEAAISTWLRSAWTFAQSLQKQVLG